MDILVVDDEPLARERLVRMVERLDDCRVVAQAANADDALTQVRQQDPDVVFLDVRMPGDDGLTAARNIAALDHPPAIIFCTAYDEYALDAFDTEAVGYLLKPVKQVQLEQVLDKAQKLNKAQLAALQRREAPTSQRTHISAKTRRGVELIPLEQVRFFVADQKYVTVYHTLGQTLIDDTLKELEQEFGERFLRVHRNALVSVPHLVGMEKAPEGHYEVCLQGMHVRPVISRRHVSRLRTLLSEL